MSHMFEKEYEGPWWTRTRERPGRGRTLDLPYHDDLAT